VTLPFPLIVYLKVPIEGFELCCSYSPVIEPRRQLGDEDFLLHSVELVDSRKFFL
jgi:hypothetical protein